VGSPRGNKSTSLSIGKYLCDKLEKAGLAIETGFIYRLMMRKQKQDQFIAMVNDAYLIVLSFPLYVDELPSPVIKAMELLYQNKEKIVNCEEKKFLAIGNCGFPEASQIDLAMEICKNFSNAMNFQWRGGIKLGGGEAIHGRDITKMGRMVRNQKKGLDLAADALLVDKPIPIEAIELISKPIIPARMYIVLGTLGWRMRAIKNWNFFNLKTQPYKDSI
jgi:hypothetical protein